LTFGFLAGETLLFCSRGLCSKYRDDELNQTLKQTGTSDVRQLCYTIIEDALVRGKAQWPDRDEELNKVGLCVMGVQPEWVETSERREGVVYVPKDVKLPLVLQGWQRRTSASL
jgi:hypothetical protein